MCFDSAAQRPDVESCPLLDTKKAKAGEATIALRSDVGALGVYPSGSPELAAVVVGHMQVGRQLNYQLHSDTCLSERWLLHSSQGPGRLLEDILVQAHSQELVFDMATQLPAKLRTPELQRFATRAAQLDKYKPIVTYWCEYYILQQLLGKNLHTTDDEAANYAVQLMDKLEQTKANNASNDAIIDDVAAKAYIENFALETFSRADNAQRANAVTKQTADTFMAAATFLDLLSIWGQPEQEITAKSKFAKFHALRIAKAFKAGEDPNATNPVVEEPPAPAEDGVDAELKELERQESGRNGSYQAPTVEHAPEDSASPSVLPQQSPIDTAPPPSAPYQPDNQVSPIEPPSSDAGRQNSVGGGYFPTVSSAPEEPTIPDVQPRAQSPQQPTSPQDFYTSAAPPPTAPSVSSFGPTSPGNTFTPSSTHASTQLPPVQPAQSPQVPQWQQPAPPPAPAPVPAAVPTPVAYQQPPPTSGFKTDDESTMMAMKHARWAISALNFEDVNTAVKELRLALQNLGAG